MTHSQPLPQRVTGRDAPEQIKSYAQDADAAGVPETPRSHYTATARSDVGTRVGSINIKMDALGKIEMAEAKTIVPSDERTRASSSSSKYFSTSSTAPASGMRSSAVEWSRGRAPENTTHKQS